MDGERENRRTAAETIEEGFQLEEPEVFIPWSISQSKLKRLFEGHEFRRKSAPFWLKAKALGGLELKFGIQYNHGKKNYLTRFFLYRDEKQDEKQSHEEFIRGEYEEFQTRLERIFGPPHESKPGSEGFLDHFWHIGEVRIVNTVFWDRFMEVHHCIICRNRDPDGILQKGNIS